MITTTLARSTLALALGTACLIAQASTGTSTNTLNVDVSHIASQGLLGASGNTVLSLNLGANTQINSLDWDVTLQAFAPSWLSELQVTLSSSDSSSAVSLAPGFGVDQAGSQHFSGHIDLTEQGLNFSVGTDGVLRLEFSERSADGLSPDGLWQSGRLSLGLAPAVPEPASYGLMALGLLAVGAATRRRR
ncbi:PEP-CTERM sorting domain-containing protein [Paucibacter sp. APW11]|uniref:PEP-CTERM sorting domain-containing protein n=1 Tax=Roseateles aquae TaxID=3077235 RepID=A0ABU3P930_9BURK|nr:PEP-CTERM sorting domain-containing protein [Paucibacter sp. APW11]MDT8999087.1 PEP-CTERM sorting domain-containing protein [Paucibacter sp. APW11]